MESVVPKPGYDLSVGTPVEAPVTDDSTDPTYDWISRFQVGTSCQNKIHQTEVRRLQFDERTSGVTNKNSDIRPLVSLVCSLFATVSGTNIHPARKTSFTVGGHHLVIDRRDTGGAQGVDITHRALIVALCLRDLFLSQSGTGHSQC